MMSQGCQASQRQEVSDALVTGVLGRVSNSIVSVKGVGVSGLLVDRGVLGLLKDLSDIHVHVSTSSSSS